MDDIQVMTEEQAREFKWNPLILPKFKKPFQSEFPLIEVGEMELMKF